MAVNRCFDLGSRFFSRLRRASKVAGVLAVLVLGLAAAKVSAAPVVYYFIAVGQNAAPGFAEIQGPVVSMGGTTYGGVGHEIIAEFAFQGDTADVQQWSFAGTNGYEIRRGVSSVTVYDASNGTVLAFGSFDPAAGMYVSIDDGNGGVGFGSQTAWGPDNAGFPGQPVYPLGKVIPTPLTYDLKSNYTSPSSVQFSGALSCAGFPGPCGDPINLPLTDGRYFNMTLPSGSINNTFIATVLPEVSFSNFSAYTTLGSGESFTVKGRFRLGNMSNGINPAAEPVTLTVNGYTAALPAGSFLQSTTGAFLYDGVVGGKSLYVVITPLGNMTYSIQATGSGAGVGSRPVSVGLTIGANTGTAMANRD